MKSRSLSKERATMKRKLESWERADHRFAVATFALLGFMTIAGFCAWLLGDKSSIAAASVHADQKTP